MRQINIWIMGLSIVVLLGLNACESKEDKREALKKTIKNDISSLLSWAKDKQLALKKLKKQPNMYSVLKGDLAEDEDVIKTVIKAGGSLRMIDKKYRKDKTLMLLSLKVKPRNFQYVDESLKNDRDVVLASLHYSYDSVVKNLKDVPSELKKDASFMLDAIKVKPTAKDPSVFSYADESLKHDKSFIVQTIAIYGAVLCESDDVFKNDRALALLALKQEGSTLQCLKKEFRYDRELVLTAAKQNGAVILMDIDPQFREDKEIVMTAINQAGPYITAGVGRVLAKDKDVKTLIAKKVAEIKK